MSAAEVERRETLAAVQRLVDLTKYGEAASVLREALAGQANDAELLARLAHVYELAEQHADARKTYYLLARLLPTDPGPYLRASQVCARVLDHTGVEKDLRKALTRDPSHDLSTTLLADLLRNQGRFDEQRETLLQRAGAGGDRAGASIARFKAAFAQPVVARGEDEAAQARERFAAALAAGPEMPIDDPFRAGLAPIFLLNYQARDDRPFQEAYARFCLAATPSLAMTAPHVGAAARGRKLRLGLFSAFFSNQTIGYLNYGLVAGLDRSRFELSLFRPSHTLHDEETDRFRAIARVVEVPPDLAAARAAIAAEKLDILHFPEIGMDAFTYFIAYSRLATVQTMAWGHPVTSGLESIDHFLSVEDMEPPDGQKHYRENLVRLKNPTFACERPPRVAASRADLGLEPGPAYVCLQSLCKVHPHFDEALAGIPAKDPTGWLYFLTNGNYADGLLKERLAKRMGRNISRVKFLPRLKREGFLALAAAADVVLDVPQWSGGRTSLEAFAMGTPVVHLPGEFMRGRHTLAFYRRMGIEAPVVKTQGEYVDTALRLVHDEKSRTETRAQIAGARSLLFEDQDAIREVEEVWSALLRART